MSKLGGKILTHKKAIRPTQFTKGDPRASAAGKKGAFAAAKAKRKKLAMKELANIVLTMPLRNGELSNPESIEDFIKEKELDNINLTVQEMSSIALAAHAAQGDVKALEFLRDTAGQKPIERVEETTFDEAAKDIDAMLAKLDTVALDDATENH